MYEGFFTIKDVIINKRDPCTISTQTFKDFKVSILNWEWKLNSFLITNFEKNKCYQNKVFGRNLHIISRCLKMNFPSYGSRVTQVNQLAIHFISLLGSNERIPYFLEMTYGQWGDKSSFSLYRFLFCGVL